MRNLEILMPARDRVELGGYDDPPLGSGEVRGRTLASIDSPGTVLAVLGGAMADAFPAHPGHAAVFEVEEVGSEVTGIAPGDRLFCQGASRTTQQYVPHLTVPVPAGIDPVTAVLARLMGVSMTTLMTTSARPGDLVAVTGLGPVGYLAAHLFRLANYEVIAVDPDARRRRWASASGISRVYEQVPHDDPRVAGRVDLVVECSGNEAAVADACKVLAMGAEVVLVGTPWVRNTEIYAQEILKAVFYRLATLRSGWEYALPLRRMPFCQPLPQPRLQQHPPHRVLRLRQRARLARRRPHPAARHGAHRLAARRRRRLPPPAAPGVRRAVPGLGLDGAVSRHDRSRAAGKPVGPHARRRPRHPLPSAAPRSR